MENVSENKRQALHKATAITFENIGYSLITENDQHPTRRNILKNLNGSFSKGLNALLGASGAGKTTFLNILAKKIHKSKGTEQDGKVFVNGSEYTENQFSRFAGFVSQDDLLLPNLTVREYIQFAADLRLDGTLQERAIEVDRTIKILHLEKCQNTFIGDSTSRGISGGEKRRVSIAIELLAQPSVLFLDEPTSGLDSFTAMHVILILKNIAVSQKSTMIFTIHQPSSDLWSMFDTASFLYEGQFVYTGPRDGVLEYFNKLGYSCPIHCNPPDYILRLMSPQSVYKDNLIAQVQQLQIQESNIKHLARVSTFASTKSEDSEDLLPELTRKKTFFEMVRILLRRQSISLSRNKIMIKARLMQVIIMGIFNALLYFQISTDKTDIKAITLRLSCHFQFSIGIIFQSMNPQVISFSQERPVFLREQGTGMYSTPAYYVSKALPELVSCSIFPIIIAVIFYWAVGLRSDSAGTVFFFFFIMILQSNVGNALGFMIGSFFKSPKMAIPMTALFMIPFIIFGGFFKNRHDLASWIGWLQYLDPAFYSFNALAENEFSGLPYNPDPIELFGLDFGKWNSAGMLIVLFFFFNIIGLLCLHRLARSSGV